MSAIIWVVAIVALAIWQLSMAKGTTELKGQPFEREMTVTPPTVTLGSHFVPQPTAVEQAFTPNEDTVTLLPAAEIAEEPAVDLMQAIVLAEILAQPRAKQMRGLRRR